MDERVLALLYDVKSACERTERFVEGKTLGNYLSDELLRSAVERQFVIMGEALSRASRIMPELEENITDFKKIVGLRNILVHGYAVVEDEVIWGIVETYVGKLKKEAETLLKK
ncbi:MAG: DUF86 domain-containing protein [Deltaproteobacteria bacterium]|nr:DUF86 domain-containing protein [Deltaproteobacteria bacterium]